MQMIMLHPLLATTYLLLILAYSLAAYMPTYFFLYYKPLWMQTLMSNTTFAISLTACMSLSIVALT